MFFQAEWPSLSALHVRYFSSSTVFSRRSCGVSSDVIKTMVFYTQSGRHLPKTNTKRSLLDFSRLRGLPRLWIPDDFAPTLLDMAGVATPDAVQGQSFYPILKGKKPKDWQKSIYYHYYEYPYYHRVQPHYGIRDQRYKLIHFYYDIDVWEFYDLKKDPLELNNLISKKVYKGRIKKLKSELYKLKKQYGNELSMEELKYITDTDFGGLESKK